MAYQPLARKYRPQRFAELIGQDATAQALANSIKLNRPIPALIFTGVRGVGKTTSARLYAKALNCEKGPTDDPCGVCDGCVAIAQGTHPDVIEVDGASHNGVDEVRLLQETLEYVPQRASYKVYIIDEVHMLSQSAFNALLKTLEEPPKHVVFIFATTEIQRVPRTIISRCQVYHLNKFSLNYITDRLRFILGQENLSFDEAALKLIAREGKGSMRDALTLLDQVIVRGNGTIDRDNVMNILRLAPGSEWIALLQALLSKNATQVVEALAAYDAKAFSYIQVTEGMATYARAAFILKEAKGSASVLQLIDMESEEIASLTAIAKGTALFELNRLFRTMVKCRADLDGGELDRFIVENYCFEWCLDPGLPDWNNQMTPDRAGMPRVAAAAPNYASPASSQQNQTQATAPINIATHGSAPDVATEAPAKQRDLKSLWKTAVSTDKPVEPVVVAKPMVDARSTTTNPVNRPGANSALSPVVAAASAAAMAASPAMISDMTVHSIDSNAIAPHSTALTGSLAAESSASAPTPAGEPVKNLQSLLERAAKIEPPAPVIPIEVAPADVAVVSRPALVFPKSWRDLVEQWKIQKPLQARLLEEAYLLSFSADMIRVTIKNESMVAQKLLQAEVQRKIAQQLQEMFGFEGRFVVEPFSEELILAPIIETPEVVEKQLNLLDIRREEKREAREQLITKVREHPLTKEALSLFNGTIDSIEVIDG